MKPIKQKVINVDIDNETVMVESNRGNCYPVDLNHYCKDIRIGDTALVSKSLNGEWLLVDVVNKYPAPLDVTDFPRNSDNELDWIEYQKYKEAIKGMSITQRIEFDEYLLDVFKEMGV